MLKSWGRIMAYEGPHPFPVKNGGTGTTTLASGVVLANGTSAFTSQSPLSVAHGGTGLSTSPPNGNLLIGNSGGTYTLAPLTGTAHQVAITNGGGSSTIALAPPVLNSTQPCFFYYLTNNVSITTTSGNSATQLGNSTPSTNTLTPLIDQTGSVTGGTFTAPVAGNYLLTMQAAFTSIFAASPAVNSGYVVIITSTNQYITRFDPVNSINSNSSFISVFVSTIAPMSLHETATFVLLITGGSGSNNATILGGSSPIRTVHLGNEMLVTGAECLKQP